MTKAVFYECTWKQCGLTIPKDDEQIQTQIERQKQSKYPLAIRCPECGSPMQRRVYSSRMV